MEIHIEGIREDLLAAAAALGDEKVTDGFRRLADTVEPSMRLRIIDLLAEVALKLNVQLDYGHVEVRMAGRWSSRLRRQPLRPRTSRPHPGTISAPASRCACPTGSRRSLEAAAAREGISANAYIVRALSRALEPRAARRSSNRLQGYARS